MVYLKSGFVAARASATPVEIGSTVDEPETTIDPATPPAPWDPGAPPTGVVAGALVAPDPPQAATRMVAARARAPTRPLDVSLTGHSSN